MAPGSARATVWRRVRHTPRQNRRAPSRDDASTQLRRRIRFDDAVERCDDVGVHGVGSRNKLTPSHARHYTSDALVDVAGRAICAADCLPRKELHEAYEMAVRISAQSDRGGRVVDLCCGFGMLAQLLLLVDERFTHAVAGDRRLPPNHVHVHAALVGAFPTLAGRVSFVQAPLHDVDVGDDDVVVSAHACGPLTDDVFARAVDVGARAAVLPCCHQFRFRDDLRGHADAARAIDDERVQRLALLGYDVVVDAIPAAVSPKNRLLLARPRS